MKVADGEAPGWFSIITIIGAATATALGLGLFFVQTFWHAQMTVVEACDERIAAVEANIPTDTSMRLILLESSQPPRLPVRFLMMEKRIEELCRLAEITYARSVCKLR